MLCQYEYCQYDKTYGDGQREGGHQQVGAAPQQEVVEVVEPFVAVYQAFAPSGVVVFFHSVGDLVGVTAWPRAGCGGS